MKKLMFAIAVVAASMAYSAVVYDGESYKTKGESANKEAYVLPSNVVNVAKKQINTWWNSMEINGVSDKIRAAVVQPVEIEFSSQQADNSYDDPLPIPVGTITTLLPTNDLNSGTELAVVPTGGAYRNYEVYLPNEPEVRAGLPAGFSLDELPAGIKGSVANGIWQAHKLPAKFILRQPYSKLVIGSVEEIDDGYDWSPVITNANLKWTGTSIAANGRYLLEGTNLHSGISLKYAYPISSGVIVTNEVAGASNLTDQGILSGTFFNNISGFDFTPPAGQNPSPSGGTTVPITIIYETKCGKRPCVFTVDMETVSL